MASKEQTKTQDPQCEPSVNTEQIKEWVEKSKTFTILLTGKTGVGKSTLANALIGQDLAVEGDTLRPETKEVESLEATINGVHITIWDSPGLQDGSDSEMGYLEGIQKKCAKVDLILHCSKMDEARLHKGDSETIRILIAVFGEDIINNCLFVLTFANKVHPPPKRQRNQSSASKPVDEKEYFKNRVAEWSEALREMVEELGIPGDVAANIPVVTAGHKDDIYLPDCEDWLSEFWKKCLQHTTIQSKPALLKINAKRLVVAESEDDMEAADDGSIVVTKESLAFVLGTGAVAGALLGPMGVAGGLALGVLLNAISEKD